MNDHLGSMTNAALAKEHQELAAFIEANEDYLYSLPEDKYPWSAIIEMLREAATRLSAQPAEVEAVEAVRCDECGARLWTQEPRP